MAQEKKEFLHIDGDEGFQSRAKSIFESLDNLEPSKESGKSASPDVARGKRRRPNQVPDHVLHPEKWTKYSLEEDGSESLGRLSANEVNRHAALSFLNEMKNRRKNIEKEAYLSSDEKHHTFAKPCAKDKDATSTDKEHATCKQGINVMPEYVVGKTKPQIKTKKNSFPPSNSTTSQHADVVVHISHVLDTDVDASDQNDIHYKEKVAFTKHKHRQNRNIRKQRPKDDNDDE